MSVCLCLYGFVSLRVDMLRVYMFGSSMFAFYALPLMLIWPRHFLCPQYTCNMLTLRLFHMVIRSHVHSFEGWAVYVSMCFLWGLGVLIKRHRSGTSAPRASNGHHTGTTWNQGMHKCQGIKRATQLHWSWTAAECIRASLFFCWMLFDTYFEKFATLCGQ